MGRSRNWSTKEEEFLEDNWGIKSMSAIAQNLGRTISAIRVKSLKLGLGRHLDGGEYVSMNQFLNAIGYHGAYSYTIERLMKLNFPMKYKKPLNKRYRVVYIEEFWEWANNNRNVLSFAKFERGALGIEPSWVEEKRNSDIINPSKAKQKRLWTKDTDNLLISMAKSNRYTYGDIAKELNRTEAAIKRRLYDLKVPYRPVPRDNHVKWTKEENEKLKELSLKGFDSYTIAKILNKTQLSISNRVKAM